MDGAVQALAAGDAETAASMGVSLSPMHENPGGDGPERPKSYPQPGDYKGHDLAIKINEFGDKLDPDGSAVSTCMVGESYCAVLDHYADAPGKLNLHPGWWALLSTLGAGGLIFYRILNEAKQDARQGEARAYGVADADMMQPGQAPPAGATLPPMRPVLDVPSGEAE